MGQEKNLSVKYMQYLRDSWGSQKRVIAGRNVRRCLYGRRHDSILRQKKKGENLKSPDKKTSKPIIIAANGWMPMAPQMQYH